METANASFGTALSCFFPEGASPSMKLRTSTPSTIKKPRTFTPFNIIDIIKPDKYSPDESLGSDDSDRDALHIDLDHTAEKENDNITRSQADDITRSQANGITRSQANGITRSQANGITRSQANGITRSSVNDNLGSADFSRSLVDGSSKQQNESVGSDDSDTDSDALHIDLDHTADENDNMRSPTNDDPKLSAKDISRPPDESVGSDDSDSDALHIDLDHTSDGEKYPVGHDITMSPTYDNPKSRADDIPGSPADDIPESPADDIPESPADDIPESPADDISGSSADDISGSSADDISGSSADDISGSSADDISGSSADDISESSSDDISESSSDDISRSPVPPHQATTADTRLGYYRNQDPHHEPSVPEFATSQCIQQSSWSPTNSVYHMYPYHMVMPSIFPSVYPTVTQYLPPPTSQSVEAHLNSTRDVVTSPNCTGRVSPAHSSSSSDESHNRSPDTSPLPSSSPATTKTPKPRPAGGRTCYTQKQVCAMEQVFSENRCPSYDVIEHMSSEIGIPHKRIKVWFQNKRARSKKRVPDSRSLHSPQVVAMQASSPGINYTMPQFPVSTPTMVSPFPGLPCPTMFSPTLC